MDDSEADVAAKAQQVPQGSCTFTGVTRPRSHRSNFEGNSLATVRDFPSDCCRNVGVSAVSVIASSVIPSSRDAA